MRKMSAQENDHFHGLTRSLRLMSRTLVFQASLFATA
jgi:hypothetical protein